jgi:hypothetical protein
MDESTNSPSSSEQSSEDNVIPFPTNRRLRLVPVDSETPEDNEESDRKFLDEFVHELALQLLSEFHEEGFDIQTKVFDKNFGFVVETIRSTLYATYDIFHPFQEIVDKCVKFAHDNDDDEFEPDPS